MSFAVTKFRAGGIKLNGPSVKRSIQRVVLEITGTTADVALDLGDDSGTFWTDALADSEYGALAAKALAALQAIVAQAVTLIDHKNDQNFDRLQAASASGTSYQVAIQNKRPNYTYAASNGETSYVVELSYELINDQFPITEEYGG